jgi:hypothetical protein
MNWHSRRWVVLLGVMLATVTGAIVLQYHSARGQHTPPNWPLFESHNNTPCFGGNGCYVCPQEGNIACTAAQPGAGWTQGLCQIGYPASKTCYDTTWSCGAEIYCDTGKGTGQNCYNGPWCKN